MQGCRGGGVRVLPALPALARSPKNKPLHAGTFMLQFSRVTRRVGQAQNSNVWYGTVRELGPSVRIIPKNEAGSILEVLWSMLLRQETAKR